MLLLSHRTQRPTGAAMFLGEACLVHGYSSMRRKVVRKCGGSMTLKLDEKREFHSQPPTLVF